MDRLPPYSLEAEEGAIACCLIDPNYAMPEAIEQLKAGPDMFYDQRLRTVYACMLEMFEKRDPVDTMTVHQRLKDRNKLDEAGGLAYFASIQDKSPSAANVTFYLKTIVEKFILRQIASHCVTYCDAVYEHSGELAPLVESFESSAMGVASSRVETRTSSMKDLVKDRLLFYEQCEAAKGALIGISTGFVDLDKMTDGLKCNEMIVLAARPSCGKTSLAMNIVEHVALGSGAACGVFSLEMSKESLTGRMISSRSRVPERHITKVLMNEREYARVASASMELAKAPIFIDDTAGLTITQLRAKARRMKTQHNIRLWVVDYLQLLRTATKRSGRQEEIAEISVGIKSMAKELDAPVIAICQLNRDFEKGGERKPRMSDLRESGQIEQDADLIGMLYPENPKDSLDGLDPLPVNMFIAKQRNGPTGVDVPFTFFKSYTRFESRSKLQ